MTKAAQAPEQLATGDILAAFGIDAGVMKRAIISGLLVAPLERTMGGHRRWTRSQLPEIVALLRARKRPVPPGWDAEMRGPKTKKAKG